MMERRRFRRAELDVPVSIRSMEQEQSASPVVGQVKDVSLAGVYCYLKDPLPFKPGELVVCSIAIPPEQTRLFPFSRILGKGWIVRAEPVPLGRREGERPPEEELIGVAVAFTPEVSALGTLEY